MEQVTEGLGNLAEAFLVSRRVSGAMPRRERGESAYSRA